MSDKQFSIPVRTSPDGVYRNSDPELEEELNNLVTARALKSFLYGQSDSIEKHGNTKDPLYHVLYHPKRTKGKAILDPKNKSENASRRAQLRRKLIAAGHKRALEGGTDLPRGKSYLRRPVPKGYKAGSPLPTPDEASKSGYRRGGMMDKTEAGTVGEALVYLNPTIRATLSKHYGGEMTMPESINVSHGRVKASHFDTYIGAWGIEIKTQTTDTGRQSTKIPSTKTGQGLVGSKADFAIANGLKMGVVTVVIDQENMRVHLLAWDNDPPRDIDGASLGIEEAILLSPPDGIKITDDDLYEALWVASQPIPLRVNPPSGYSVLVDKKNGKTVVIPQGSIKVGKDGKQVTGLVHNSPLS